MDQVTAKILYRLCFTYQMEEGIAEERRYDLGGGLKKKKVIVTKIYCVLSI